MKYIILFQLYFISLFGYSQTQEDYDVYTEYIKLYGKDLPIFVLTNSLSDFSLSRLDKRYIRNSTYTLSENRFVLDTMYFNLDQYCIVDKTNGNLKESEVSQILSDTLSSELLTQLKSQLFHKTEFNNKRFSCDIPIKILKRKTVDKQYEYGKLKVNNKNVQKFNEFSTIVYLQDYAMFYASFCDGNCPDVVAGFGCIVLMQKVEGLWDLIGIARIYNQYD